MISRGFVYNSLSPLLRNAREPAQTTYTKRHRRRAVLYSNWRCWSALSAAKHNVANVHTLSQVGNDNVWAVVVRYASPECKRVQSINTRLSFFPQTLLRPFLLWICRSLHVSFDQAFGVNSMELVSTILRKVLHGFNFIKASAAFGDVGIQNTSVISKRSWIWRNIRRLIRRRFSVVEWIFVR